MPLDYRQSLGSQDTVWKCGARIWMHVQMETWEAGVETQENKKIFVPLSKKDKNKKSHERWTQASVTALLVQGSRITYHQVPLNERVVTVIYLVQIEPKNGFKTEKVKDRYRECGYLPLPPTSHCKLVAKVRHDSFTLVTHSRIRHDSFIRVT